MSHRLARLTTLAVLALAAAARGDIDVEVGNGDIVTGTIAPATETEVIRFRVPAGATITIKAKAAKKGPELHLVLRDPAGTELRTADGKSAVVAGIVAAASGVHSAEVTSKNGTAGGDYSVSIAWKSPSKATATATLAGGDGASVNFTADLGAVATLSVKPAKGSKAVGALTSLTGPGPSLELLVGTSAKRTLASGGDFVLAFRNAGDTAGDLTATVKIKAPKPSKKKIALTSKVIDPGGQFADFALAGLLGTSGGTITVPVVPPGDPGAALSGTSVSVPAGALGAPTTIIVATAPPITPPGGGQGAGPTVFFGPEGTQFDKKDKTTRATISLPYDPAFDSLIEGVQIFTRDAKGKVTVVPPQSYTLDKSAHTITFPTSHFSSFRAMAPDTEGQVALLTYANVTDPRDVCFANEPGSPTLPALYYVAAGAAKVVIALRLDQTSIMLTPETWAGGGALTADGTPRLQYQFPGAVVSVTSSLNNQELFVATSTQIFRVGSDENVSLYAGTGTASDTGDDGAATAATFVSITSVVVDDSDDSLYIADIGAHRIRRIDAVSHNVTAWAGTGTTGISLDDLAIETTAFVGPRDMAVADAPDRGLYVADGARVRHLAPAIPAVAPFINTTVAGSAGGAVGSDGDDGPVLSARFEQISGITRLFDVSQPTVLKFVVSDDVDHTLRLIDLAGDKVTLLAGTHDVSGFSGDFSSFPGLLDGPRGVFALPSVSTFQVAFADAGNGKIRVRFVGPGFP